MIDAKTGAPVLLQGKMDERSAGNFYFSGIISRSASWSLFILFFFFLRDVLLGLETIISM